jgi:hypothetical protein
MEQINKLRKLKSWNAPVALDRGASLSEGQTAQRYGVSGFPTVIIIDRDGKIGFNTSVEPKDRAAFLRSMQAVAKSAKIAFPSDKNGSDAEAEKQMNALVNALLSAEIDASLARRARKECHPAPATRYADEWRLANPSFRERIRVPRAPKGEIRPIPWEGSTAEPVAVNRFRERFRGQTVDSK